MKLQLKYHLSLLGLWCTFNLLCTANFAQQRPQYTQYLFNNFLLNPALAGIEDYHDIRLGVRNQWAGFEGAPKTLFITGSFSGGKNLTISNAMKYAQSKNYTTQPEYISSYRAAQNHHGMGFTLLGDQIGPFKNLFAHFNYAYHIQLNTKLNLSVGASIGLINIGFDRNALNFENNNDPTVNNFIPNQLKPDASVGTWLYGARFFLGASIKNVIPQQIQFTNDYSNNAQGKFVPHIFITGGYKLFILDNVSFTPSMMFKYVNPAPLSYDINAKFAYKDRIWLGAGYRNNDAVTGIFGINISPSMNFTYAYDFTTSSLRTQTSGSHEVMVGILLKNTHKVICPQKMW